MDKAGSNPHIIGLTGSFGSGCTYIADNILAREGYQKVSLSHILRGLYQERNGEPHKSRNDLQKFGDSLRKAEGPDFLARKAIAEVQASPAGDKPWVVDSIRNPHEIEALRDCSRNFYLVGVYADKETRWSRVRNGSAGYSGNRNAFDRDDHIDTGQDSEAFGQRVSDCFYEADIVLRNEDRIQAIGNADFKQFKSKVIRYVSLVQNPLSHSQVTNNDESIMAMAYAVGQRSSCMQRKVGAIITDGTGSVISSGFNEVPPGEKPCLDEHTKCYRAGRRQAFLASLDKIIDGFDRYSVQVEKEFKEQFRVLDICRALHAEENAILNLARHGRSAIAQECTLFTTTYPCRLCANKIAQLGIRRVVYLEPYPDEEAKAILDGQAITTDFFEGVTFRAYFRVYGEKK